MKALRSHWVALALLYGLFLYWYGGCTTPLSPEEVEHYLAVVAARSEDDPDVVERMRTFAATDDGGEFFMVNLVRYRDQPLYADGRDPGGDVYEVERRYAGRMLPKLLARACHPVAGGERIASLATVEGETPWHRVMMVRYRSRRDFLEIAMSPEFEDDVVHKWAAVEKTHAFAAKPEFSLATPRLLVLGILALAGRALDWRGRRKRRAAH
jgi:hypothetical protein